MKILVVPSFFITNYKSREFYRKINFIKNILKLNIKSALYSFNEHLLSDIEHCESHDDLDLF